MLQLYGKSCENVLNRLKVTFCKSFWHYDRVRSSSGFKDLKIVTDDLVIAYQIPEEVTLNKPIQVASAILDHSKRYFYFCGIYIFILFIKIHIFSIMFEKWYDFIVPSFPSVSLGMSDTDSFLFSCVLPKGQTLCEKLAEHKEHFDFSNLPESHPLFCPHRKNELGM